MHGMCSQLSSISGLQAGEVRVESALNCLEFPVCVQVKYAWDVRSVWVTTRPSAPGGERTEKVGLPFDPDLYEHMLQHGVFVEDPSVRLTHPGVPTLKYRLI